MNRIIAVLLGALVLSGCGDGNPFDPIPGEDEETTEPDEDTGDGDEDPLDEENPLTDAGIRSSLANDLERFTYDPVAETLTVEGITLDETPVIATYVRNAALDVPGYEAYTIQDDPLDRHATAFVAESADGAMQAGVVVTGGQFNRYFGGGYYERDGGYTPPDAATAGSGLVTYAGQYAGLTNIAGPGGDLLPAPGGVAPENLPTQALAVTGDVIFNVDFADNAINGQITNRDFVGVAVGLPSIALIETTISDSGDFFGNAEVAGDIGNDVGDYGGRIGGTDGSSLAGTAFFAEHMEALFDNEEEYGVFVLNRCGTPDEDAVVCATVE